MVTKWIFLGLVLLLALQRLLEMRLSRRNETHLRAQGGQEHAPGHFQAMKALHAGWFLSMIGEVFGLNRPFLPWLAALALLGLVAGQALRYAAIYTLGKRWTVRIFTLPGAPPIQHGIYRYLRHPNYLGVILEVAAVPLLHTAYLTAIVFSSLNAGLFVVRIRAEENALRADNDYANAFADRPRFLPRASGKK